MWFNKRMLSLSLVDTTTDVTVLKGVKERFNLIKAKETKDTLIKHILGYERLFNTITSHVGGVEENKHKTG